MLYPIVLIGVDGSDADRDAIAVAHRIVRNYDQLILGDVCLGRGLHDVAERAAADLIIVGRGRRSPCGRPVLRADARSALDHAPCTVAVAPAGYADRACPPRRIGVAYDGSRHSGIPLRHAVRLASQLGATVAATDIVQLPQYADAGGWSLIDRTDAQLAAVRSSLNDVDDVEVSVTVGVTRDALERFSHTVDALFCGSRRYGPRARVTLGSTSDHLAQHAGCPLFVTAGRAEALVASHNPTTTWTTNSTKPAFGG